MPIPFPFDFKNPDYRMVLEWRRERLQRILQAVKKDEKVLTELKFFYRENPAQFIIDWGQTYDPRNAASGLPNSIPFLLFPKQEEWVQWAVQLIKDKESGVNDKSRDMGVTWLFMAFACTACLFNNGLSFGVGSRKEEYVDSLSSPKAILYKGRKFIEGVPRIFKGNWSIKDAPFKTIKFPDTGSVITGEAGDGIGRGDRATAYFVDEAAFLPRPETTDASLSQTTNSVFWVSTPHGRNNPFAYKRFGGHLKVFSMHWREDPRKDEDWYKKQCDQLDNEALIAQELDLNYDASVEGVVIPAIWVEAAVEAHLKLNIPLKGERHAALDVADEGRDLNAFVGAQGVIVDFITAWSGKGSDIYDTTVKAFGLADTMNYDCVYFDSDGLGAGVRGDAKKISKERESNNRPPISFVPFRSSGAVVNPDLEILTNERKTATTRTTSRTNEDYFENVKAQAWFELRERFKKTYKMVVEGHVYPLDELISISKCDNYLKLKAELSQPTYFQNDRGKIVIDKTPDGARSPNYADACMIRFAPKAKRMGILGNVK